MLLSFITKTSMMNEDLSRIEVDITDHFLLLAESGLALHVFALARKPEKSLCQGEVHY